VGRRKGGIPTAGWGSIREILRRQIRHRAAGRGTIRDPDRIGLHDQRQRRLTEDQDLSRIHWALLDPT
jgi:hypothetical protein